MAIAKGSSAVMASKRARLSDGKPWQKLALFCTPPWATRALFEVVLPRLGFWHVGLSYDPCMGLGHMASVLREYSDAVTCSDIYRYGYGPGGVDAGDVGQMRRFLGSLRPDWIIVNPPFSPDPPYKTAAELLPGLLELAGEGVAMLCRLQWLETDERFMLFRTTPPSHVAVFSERVAMCEGGYDPACKTATACAWFIWTRNAAGEWAADVQPTYPIFPTSLIMPGQKQALFRPSDLELAKRHVPGWVPPSMLRKQRAALERAKGQRKKTKEIKPLPEDGPILRFIDGDAA